MYASYLLENWSIKLSKYPSQNLQQIIVDIKENPTLYY